MARRTRVGLDYFPLDTSWDLNIRLLKVQFGLEGLGTIIELFQMIYHEGYALKWNNETQQLFCSENRIEEAHLETILEFCICHDLFDRRLYETRRVLTSRAIQRQWLRICIDAKRKISSIEPDLNLCPEESLENERLQEGKPPEKSRIIREYSRGKQELSEERKEKEKTEKKSKGDNDATHDGAPPASIPALIDNLAAEKRAFPGKHGENQESISMRFQKFIKKVGNS